MKRFRKLKRLSFALVLTLIILLLLAAIMLPYAARTGRLTGFIERALTHALGARTDIETVSLAPFSELTLNGVTVYAPKSYSGSRPPGGNSADAVIFRCDRVSIRYSICDLLKTKLALTDTSLTKLDSISISRPVVMLEKRRDGQWNYTPPAGESRLSVDTLRVENGALKITVENTPYEIGGASIALHDFGPGRRSRIYAHAFVGEPGSDIYAIGAFCIGSDGPEGDIRLGVSRIPLGLLERGLRGDLEDSELVTTVRSDRSSEKEKHISGEVNGGLTVCMQGGKLAIKESRAYITELELSSADGQLAVSNAACHLDINATATIADSALASHVVGSGSLTSGSLRIKDLIYPPRQIANNEAVNFDFNVEIQSDSKGWGVSVSADKPWRLNVPGIAQFFAYGRIKGTDDYQEVDISVRHQKFQGAHPAQTDDSPTTESETIGGANKNTIRIKGRFDTGSRRAPELIIAASEIELNELWRNIQPLILPRMAGWQFGGRLSLDVSMKTDLTSIHPTQIDLRNFSFMSPDGESGCEGLGARLSASAQLIMEDSAPVGVAFGLEGDLGGFDFIMGSFGVSLPDESKRAKFSASGSYSLREEQLDIRCKLDWPDFGAAQINGELTGPLADPNANLNIELDNISNDEVFTQLVKDNYSMLYPFLDNMSLSGKSHLACSFTGSLGKFNLKGDMSSVGASVRMGDFVVDGLEVSLPFSFELPRGSQAGAKGKDLRSISAVETDHKKMSDYGKITIRKVANGPITLSNLQIEAAVLSNDFITRQDLTFPLFGGSVTAKNLTIRDILSPRPKPLMGLYVDDLDISKLTEAYNLPAIKGKLKARFEKISLEGNDLILKGNAAAEVFKGVVRVGDIKIENPLEEYRTFSLSAKLEDMDLESLSSEAGIGKLGKVTGRMQGSIKHLEIAAGRPMHFEADLETVKRQGVNQTVSLDFVQSLSLVASGAPPVFGQIVRDWGRVYRYDRFGMTCKMRYGDILTINGKFIKNGKEFLMQGPLWGGMNIINEDPGKQVSFREISDRLKDVISG